MAYDLKPFGWNPPGPVPQPARGPAYPSDPLQASIDRIRASQKPKPVQPQITPEQVLAHTTNAALGPGQDAWTAQQMAEIPIAQPEPIPEAAWPSRQDARAGLWETWVAKGEQQHDTDRLNASIQEGAEREAGDLQAEENQRAWLNQQVAEIPIQQTDVLTAPALGEHPPAPSMAEIDAAGTPAGSGVSVQPAPKAAPVDPARGFAGNHRRAESGQRRAVNTRRSRNGGWSDPADAPLPGEETLPPAVAQWNQARASQGQAGGMQQLRTAYEIAERNVPSGMTFEEWVSSQGIGPDTPPMEAQARLEAIVARNAREYPNSDPLMEGRGPDPRIDRDDDSILSGRRGVADNTPLDLMSPEQRQMIGSHHDGVPRTARGGYHVWDETAGESGGYAPRAVDRAAAAEANARGDIRAEAEAYGIDHMAYGDNLPQLEADVAKVRKRQVELARNYDTQAVPGGGHRLVPNAYARQRQDEARAQQFGRTMARRFAREMKDTGLPAQDVLALYRQHLASNPGDYAGAARLANQQYLDPLRMRRDMDRQLAVQQNADQYNRSRRFGVSQGTVAFFDSLQNAKTPEERANILMLAHASQPGMGWDKMAAMLTKGEIDNEAMSQWAANMQQKPDAAQKISANVNNFLNAGAGMETFAQITNHVSSMPGFANAKPELVRAEVRRYAMPVVQNAIATGNFNTPDQIAFIRSVTSDDPNQPADPGVFSNITGIPQNDPRFKPVYRQIFGTDPATGFGTNLWAGLGWLFSPLAGGISPNAWAGSPPQGPSQ